MMYLGNCASPLGELVLASDGERLCGLWMKGQKFFGEGLPENTMLQEDVPVFSMARDWLSRYFAGEKPGHGELPLAPLGSPFRQMVWDILLGIPMGRVITYGDIARQVADKTGRAAMSPQAIGGAVGHNRLAIIIPCHRVVGSDGSLTGYSGGIARKTWLLAHEGLDMKRFTVPQKGTAL